MDKATYDYDVFVIGSGSAGGSAALAASALGKKVAVAERKTLGGECPNYACVPTKALLKVADVYRTVKEASEFGVMVSDVKLDYTKIRARKDKVVSRTGAARATETFGKAKVDIIRGDVKFTSPHEVEVDGKKISADKFVLATGTTTFIPPVEGLADVGYVTNEEAIDWAELPAVVGIMGGGPVGTEFAEIFSMFGAKVLIFEKNLRVIPREDDEVGEFLMKKFASQGVEFIGNITVSKTERKADQIIVTVSDESGKTTEYPVDQLLVASGKRPAIDNLNLEIAGVEYDGKSVKVDETLKTTADHIYAAGDIVGPFMFTHTAHYQGDIAGHNAASEEKEKAIEVVIPRCVFTEPEVASVGETESQLKEKGVQYKAGKFPIGVLGKANANEKLEGFVKIVIDAKTEQILGASMVAPGAGEMIHEVALAMEAGISAQTIANMIHAYPTYSEAVKGAAIEALYAE